MRGTVRRKSSITYDGEVPVISRNDAGRLPVAARFVETVKSVEVEEGETACFECKIKGNPAPDVQWFKNGVELIPADRIWTETRKDGRHSLLIKNAKGKDLGTYRCTVINKLGRDSSVGMLRFRKVPLSDDVFSGSDAFDVCDVINGRPEHSPEFIEVPQVTVGEEGETVTFECQVLGYPLPTLDWYKGCDKISTSLRYIARSSPGTPGKFSLQIQDLCSADAGTYRCVATNKIGKSACTFELIYAANQYLKEMSLDRAPSFSQTLTSMEVKSGERARFECRVEGKPKPSVSWRKDGRLLSQSTRVRIMEICGNHSLVLPRTNVADSGVYSFTASNKLGSNTTKSELIVQDMSSNRNQFSSSRRGSNPSNLSSPSLSPKLSRAAASRLVTGSSSPFGSNLKSTNRGGSGGPQRRRAPGFILRPRPLNIVVGEKLSLKCTLLGHPKPTVTWEKDGELVDEEKTGGHICTRVEGNDYFLEINQSGPEDAGKYCVTARNSLGKQTATVEVSVGGSNGVTKTIHVDKTSTKSNLPNANGSAIRQDDVINHKQQSSLSSTTSEEDRKPGRVPDLHIPANLRPDDTKDSPTSSISSTMSSQSRISSSSSASRHDADPEEHRDTRPSVRHPRRRNIVAPAFLRRLSSTQVLEGEELLLQCEVSGDPDPRMAWRRNGSEVSIDEDEVFTSYRDGVARLRLRDVQPQHAGEYVCVASNDAGTVQCSSRVTVKVKQVKTRPHFIKSPADVRATEGETLTLEAEVEGTPSPEILWSLDGEEVTNGDATFHNNIARLILHKVSPSSSGQYMCTALNPHGEDSVACRVRVKAKQTDMKPDFTAPLSDVTVDEGYDVCLRCMVTGIPEPSVEWQCDGNIIEDEEGIGMSYQDGVAALTLEHATEEDSGIYTCVAVNNEGRASTKCTVTVKAPKAEKTTPASPPKFATTFDEYIRPQEGDTVELECKVTGNPAPEVTWSIADKNVENSTITFEDGIARIVISPITANHGGHIKCQLSNQAGKASHEARLYVRSKRVAPTFDTLLPESITIRDGEETVFQCKVTGHPQPRLTWTRDGRSLNVLSTETSYENGVASVRIRKAGPREAGKYVCVARNLSGEAETVCLVRYEEKSTSKPPQFTTMLHDVTLPDGDDLRLECKIVGDPTPEVTWELDGHKFDSEEADISFKNGIATLILEDTMPEDSGDYTCIAVNSAGRNTCSCHVTVQEKPVEPVKPLKSDPSFPITLDDVTVKEGEDIFLHCQVLGNPRPTITWLLDGDKLTDADIKYMDDGNVELFLGEAIPDDEGVYTCIAENPLKRVMTSCKVTIDALPRPKGKQRKQAKQQVESKPSFIQALQDTIVQDGSTDFELRCRVSGNPTVQAQWFLDDEEISPSEDFRMESEGDVRKLIFTEVFPDDSGTYTCVISNPAGEERCSCDLAVQEIDGEAPTFLLKPKPMTVSAGQKAMFTCRVDGDPAPTVHWMYCNQPIEKFDRVRITDADASNNYTHSLEISQVSSQDAGRYSVCSRNLLGDVTCTVSLIVGDSKRQEVDTDFRKNLKKSSSPVKTANKAAAAENVDFRVVLKKASVDTDRPTTQKDTSNDPDYKGVLSTTVKTKTLTEDERKMLKAEQQDFRSSLVRKVDTKVVTQDALRAKETEQVNFREDTLKTKVRTKTVGQDEIKLMRPEQKDFRADTIKSKVVTKAYKEDEIKTKRAEQVDFRKVLSPTKRTEGEERSREPEEGTKIADIPRSKWKKEVDHTTVSTKRARHRGAGVPDKQAHRSEEDQQQEESSEEEELLEEEVPSWSKPEIIEAISDLTIKDAEPFELVCRVAGDPRPEVKWFLEGEEIEPEDDIITITYEDEICCLTVSESVPEDQGKYTFTATNEHGDASCHCYVTVLSDETNNNAQVALAPRVTTGPADLTVRKGGPIRLGCAMEGSPPLKVVWRKGRDEIHLERPNHIDTSNTFTELCITSSGRDDSGCYTLQLSNAYGVDQFSVNVKVVDVPDPPGKPFAEVRPGKGMVVSWYGCAYDGGSHVEDYKLEIAKVTDAKSKIRWIKVTSTNSTSHTVEAVEHNEDYKFRVSARNVHGLGKPGPSSDVVRYLAKAITNGIESTDDENEDEFVKYQPVEIKENVKFSSRYEIREKLGQGRFGKVHRVVDRKTGEEYAAKIMKALKAKDRQAVALEIEIMNQLRHPKLVQLIEAYQHAREVTMVMDLVAGGELFERVIDEDFELTEAACIKYMRQICRGVKFMHDNSIIHLDLKPENIMCVDKTGTRVKLIDFGLARKYSKNETMRVMLGTPEFVAPEVINYDAIGFETDMWSVGVICYILLSGLSPFSGDMDSETLSNVTAASWDFDDEAFDQISEDAKDFISRLLVKHLKSRYSVEQALGHNWLRKNTAKMQKSKLDTKNLKRFLARRKWQKTANAVRALGRLASLAKLSPSNSHGQRESGFLTSLRAELEREKEAEQFLTDQHKPRFVESFRDAKVIAGSETRFSCVITGSPEPVVTWYRNGKQFESSRRFRLSYSDYTASLYISRTLEHDEGEYTCRAVNSEGEASHTAQLLVTNFRQRKSK